jgi:tetratricopeptide (TPR) repeat protein
MADVEAMALRASVIVVLGLAVYWPALTGDWLWDDRDLITKNALVQDPNGLWRIWLEPWRLFDFFPLVVSATWIEWRLFGEDTLGYHLVNLALHLTSAFLFWRLLRQLGLRHAWLGAVIFTVHPVIVESVAWMAELKNTLSLPFFLLAMSAWIEFEARGKTRDYVQALVMFLLAMLAKATMVMFPFVILLYAWWRRSRIDARDVLRSVPFFAISLAIGAAVAWFLGRTTGEQHVVLGGPLPRLALAGCSIAFYFSKSFLPVGLLPIYHQWRIDPPSPWEFLPWIVIGAVLWFLWTQRNGWGRPALLGIGFFLLNLLPFIGLTAGSYMEKTWVMDHFLYIPILGLIGLFVAGIEPLERQLSAGARRVGIGVLALIVAAMTWAANSQAALYDRTIALWEYTVPRVPESAVAHFNYGVGLFRENRVGEAVTQFQIAQKLLPTDFDFPYTLGLVYGQMGRYDLGIPELRIALQLSPNRVESHFSLASALHQSGQTAEAIEQYKQALQIDPNYIAAYHSLAVCLANEGRWAEAMDVAQRGLQVDPQNAQLKNDMAQIAAMEQKVSAKTKP